MGKNYSIPIPQCPIIQRDTNGYVSREWFMFFSQPNFTSITLDGVLPVSEGGTGISGGAQGAVLYFATADKMGAFGPAADNRFLFGGGASGFPYSTPLGPGNNRQMLMGSDTPLEIPNWYTLRNGLGISLVFDDFNRTVTVNAIPLPPPPQNAAMSVARVWAVT